MAERILSKERRALIADWRKHRAELLRLATELNGWHYVADHLNSFLTWDDMLTHMADAGIEPDDLAQAFLGEREKLHSSEPLSPDQR